MIVYPLPPNGSSQFGMRSGLSQFQDYTLSPPAVVQWYNSWKQTEKKKINESKETIPHKMIVISFLIMFNKRKV